MVRCCLTFHRLHGFWSTFIFFLAIFFPISLTSFSSPLQYCSTCTRLPLGLASAAPSAPPPFLFRSLASISLAAASHEARWVTATHTHADTWSQSQQHYSSVDLSTHLRSQPPTDESGGNLEKLSNVTLTHEERNLNEEDNELLLFADWKVSKSCCIAQCVIVRGINWLMDCR